MANGTPPRFMAISITVWVEDGPGSIMQKELYSSNSSSVTSFLFCTKVRTIMPMCPCGPPKAVKEYKNTAFKNGTCLSIRW